MRVRLVAALSTHLGPEADGVGDGLHDVGVAPDEKAACMKGDEGSEERTRKDGQKGQKRMA